MKMRAICLFLVAAILAALFSGCSGESVTGPVWGSRSNPVLPGEAITFNGMGSDDANAQYVVDITYLDVVRGEEAMKIFLAGSFRLPPNGIPDDSELVLVKLDLHVQEAADDSPIALDVDNAWFFQTVSGGGISYDFFPERRYIRQNLFRNMHAGARQTAHRFFLVDRDDPDPLMVIHPEINGGLWFRLSVCDNDDRRTDRRIDIADWGDGMAVLLGRPDTLFEVSGNFAGALSDPLPMGQWGLWRGNVATTNNILEMMIERVERGDAAANRLLSTSTNHNAMLTGTQEIMAVLFNINVLHTRDGTGVLLSEHTFELITTDRNPVDVIIPFNNSTYRLPVAFPGASHSGWVFFVVEQSDTDLLISPSSFSGYRLWISTDPQASFPTGKDEYTPQHDPSLRVRDERAPVGSLQNPTPPGSVGTATVDTSVRSYEAEIEILEVVRGEGARGQINSTMQRTVDGRTPAGYELVAVLMDVTVTSSESDAPVDIATNLHLVGGDRVLSRERVGSAWTVDPLGTILPQTPTRGWVVFIARQDSADFLLNVSFTTSMAATWFELPKPTDASEWQGRDDQATTPPTQRIQSQLTDGERRALAFGAVLATRNRMDFDSLFGHTADDNAASRIRRQRSARSALQGGWGIRNGEDAVEMLERLLDGLHHRNFNDGMGFDHIFDIAMERSRGSLVDRTLFGDRIEAVHVVTDVLISRYGFTEEELARVTTVSAWDFDRMVTVARLAYIAGWLTEEQAWYYIHRAAEAGAADYTDWRSYFAGVMYGRAIWSSDRFFTPENARIAEALLSSSESIYNEVPFRTVTGVAI